MKILTFAPFHFFILWSTPCCVENPQALRSPTSAEQEVLRATPSASGLFTPLWPDLPSLLPASASPGTVILPPPPGSLIPPAPPWAVVAPSLPRTSGSLVPPHLHRAPPSLRLHLCPQSPCHHNSPKAPWLHLHRFSRWLFCHTFILFGFNFQGLLVCL